MKVTIIEGSPEELADYETRTGMIGQAHAAMGALGRVEDPLATGPASRSTGRTSRTAPGSGPSSSAGRVTRGSAHA